MPSVIAGLDYVENGAGQYTFTSDFDGNREIEITYSWVLPRRWVSGLSDVGLSLATGSIGQPIWSWLQSYAPGQAVPYSGTAYVYAQNYALSNQAEVDNHSFEVISGHGIDGLGGAINDAWPDVILRDFLVTNTSSVGWSAGRLADMTQLKNYVRARQLWLSVAMAEQKPARDWLQGLADICNCQWTWQGGQLDLIPRGDEVIASTYGNYTPLITPVFDLVHGEGGDLLEAVEIEPVVNEDANNIIKIEWTNRANAYAIEVMTASDQAHIELFGQRPAGVVAMHAIHTAAVASSVAQQMLQREMTVWNKYRFKVPFSRALMGLMDLVTLTDADSALDRVPVRIISRSESGTMEYTYEAEDAPIGSATAPLYGTQAGTGFAHDYNAVAGAVAAPFFFEPPVQLTTTGLEVWVAVTGLMAQWGGCTVWASNDGLNYKQVGSTYGGARYGALSANLGTSNADTMGVALTGLGGQLLSGSAADVAANQMLVLVGDVNGGEYLNFQTATLTGANAYNLTQLSRGAYRSAPKARLANQATVVRVDSSIAKSEPLQPAQVGQPLYFKFTSFNVYGGGEQALADATEYTYTPTGYMLRLKPPNVTSFVFDGASKFTWSAVDLPRNLLAGYRIKFQYGNNQSAADAVALNSDVITDSPYTAGIVPQGPITFMIWAVDIFGNESAAPAVIVTQLGDAVTANVLQAVDYKAAGWPGTITGSAGVSGGNIVATNGAGAFGGVLTSAFSGVASAAAFAASYAGIGYSTPPFVPSSAGRLTLLHTVVAEQYQVNYRPSNPAPAFLNTGLEAAFAQMGTDAAFAAPPAWLVWPGAIEASTQPYEFEVICGIGGVQQQITRLLAQVDVPDINLRLANVAISAGGTRLAAAIGRFTAITNINLTLQSDGTVLDAQYTDKSVALGPRVICLDKNVTQVAGTVDALIQGY